jgi:succinate dehydrogenase/fumarate reductase flavoprotein subunit
LRSRKKSIYRQVRRHGVEVSNRLTATRLLTAPDGRIAGAIALDSREGRLVVARQGGHPPPLWLD